MPQSTVPCKCNCGGLVVTPDRWGIARKFLRNHAQRVKGRRYLNGHPQHERLRGSKMPPEKRKLFDRTGKPPYNKGTRSPMGEKHWNWKRGITKAKKLERTKFLKYTQPKVFARDNYTCQICHQYGGNLQVDHIKSWAEYPELRFDTSNCRTLCMACHYYITFKRKIPDGVIWGHNLSRRKAA